MEFAYTSICQLIYHEIYDTLKKKTNDNRFAPRGTIKVLLQRGNHHLLRRLFRCIVPTGQLVFHQALVSENEFVRRVEARKLPNFWGALLFASCSIEAAITALQRLVAVDAWPVFENDTRKFALLPLCRA